MKKFDITNFTSRTSQTLSNTMDVIFDYQIFFYPHEKLHGMRHFVRDNGTNQTKEGYRGRKPVSKKLLARPNITNSMNYNG